MGNSQPTGSYSDGDGDSDQTETCLGMGASWWPFFAIVLFMVAMQTISTVAMLLWCYTSCRRRFRPRPAEVDEAVAVVVPCYLPNEAPIIADTIRHILEETEGIKAFDLHVVYNTPTDMEIEEELQAMAKASPYPGERRLFVERVKGSRSKAENLNHVVPRLTSKYTVIYDADHHPDPDGLCLAIAHLEANKLDCVQGSTYIREGCCLMRMLIHAEFFVCYFVTLPILRHIAGTGFFGGANGIWLTTSLQRLRFDEHKLTEDIDCFARAIMRDGLRFDFLPECRSGELAPFNLRALWKQRLRWAMGWDEVTLSYASGFWKAALPVRLRLGLYYIFVCRWLTQACALIVFLFSVSVSAENIIKLVRLYGDADEDGDTGDDGGEPKTVTPKCISDLQIVSFEMFMGFIGFSFLQALLQRQDLRLLLGLVLYYQLLPVILLTNSVVSIVSLIRVSSGNTGAWVVTTRTGGDRSPRSLDGRSFSAPLLGLQAAPKFAFWALFMGLTAIGSGLGAIVGAVLGRHTEVHPLWGWVPFGIGETHEEVIDGRMVSLGMAIGAFAGASLGCGLVVQMSVNAVK